MNSNNLSVVAPKNSSRKCCFSAGYYFLSPICLLTSNLLGASRPASEWGDPCTTGEK